MSFQRNKGWLSKKDFELADDLFSKLGFGGYYDFLECLKAVARNIGAFTTPTGDVDRDDVKTILEVIAYLDVWSEGIFQYRCNVCKDFQFDKDILKLLVKKKET